MKTCADVTFVGGVFDDNDDDDDDDDDDDVDGDENCFSFPLSWSLVTLEGWQWVRPRLHTRQFHHCYHHHHHHHHHYHHHNHDHHHHNHRHHQHQHLPSPHHCQIEFWCLMLCHKQKWPSPNPWIPNTKHTVPSHHFTLLHSQPKVESSWSDLSECSSSSPLQMPPFRVFLKRRTRKKNGYFCILMSMLFLIIMMTIGMIRMIMVITMVVTVANVVKLHTSWLKVQTARKRDE